MNQVATVEPPSIIQTMASKYGMERRAFEATLKATVVPGNVSNEQFAAFLVVAHEYGLNPLTKEIYAFPAKGGGIQPIVSIDGWCNIINSHPNMDGMEFDDVMTDGKLTAIVCKLYRKDRSKPITCTEYMSECAKKTEPWEKWPARMLRHKALIQCARYAFGFSGIVDPDEAERMLDVTPTVTNPTTGEVMAKLPSPFKNAAARKEYCKNAAETFGKETTVPGLLTTFALYEARIIEMECSTNEHDVLGAEEMRKQYAIQLNRLKISTREDAVYEDAPTFDPEEVPAYVRSEFEAPDFRKDV